MDKSSTSSSEHIYSTIEKLSEDKKLIDHLMSSIRHIQPSASILSHLKDVTDKMESKNSSTLSFMRSKYESPYKPLSDCNYLVEFPNSLMNTEEMIKHVQALPLDKYTEDTVSLIARYKDLHYLTKKIPLKFRSLYYYEVAWSKAIVHNHCTLEEYPHRSTRKLLNLITKIMILYANHNDEEKMTYWFNKWWSMWKTEPNIRFVSTTYKEALDHEL